MKRWRAAALGAALLLAGCVTAPRGSAPAKPPPAEAQPLPTPALATPEALLARPDLSGTRAALAAAGMTVAAATAGRTLLAPDDAAWGLLPPGTAAALLRPENRPTLLRLIRYWTLPGRMTTDDLAARAAAGSRLSTLAGEAIALASAGGATMLTDAQGRRAYAERGAASASGGVIVVNGLIAPASIEPGRVPPQVQ